MSILERARKEIHPVDKSWYKIAQKRLDNLTKPRGSLGRLEEFAMRLVAIRADKDIAPGRKVIFTFAGDHGVTAEGVSAYPKAVTPQMVLNFLRGGAGINVLARHAGAEVVVIDIGVDHDFGDIPGLIRRKVVSGTGNFAEVPAMTRDEAVRSIEVGVELACDHAEKGYAMFGTGEMGIGNTTPSSAIAAVLTGKPVPEVTGRGTGIADETLRTKIAVIERSLRLHRPDPKDGLDVL
ncbi:MAG TPA: nicotinate-nucleotide--dimethylbenzimidazole phosphoribosyltransferase, partial [Dissulfurispiraceae bacterium]|nr:nicotinate-nucleotide--dimethylbenzimidazole phosphoribosyltransferase [Dissulfurispiraceae bacterium]